MKTLLIFSLLIFSACSKIEDGSVKPPLVYRIDIQQGNVVDQDMVSKLKVGMDMKQVRFIMGTPLLIDPFHKERWDYVYTYQEGTGRRQQRHITLFFEEEKLAFIRGDIKVSHIPTKRDDTNTEKSVVVPANAGDKTLLERWLIDKDTETEFNPEESSEDTPAPEPPATQTSRQEPVEEEAETSVTAVEEVPADTETAESVTVAEEIPADAETAEDEPGFFGSLWDRLSSDDEDAPPPDAEVLQPKLENR